MEFQNRPHPVDKLQATLFIQDQTLWYCFIYARYTRDRLSCVSLTSFFNLLIMKFWYSLSRLYFTLVAVNEFIQALNKSDMKGSKLQFTSRILKFHDRVGANKNEFKIIKRDGKKMKEMPIEPSGKNKMLNLERQFEQMILNRSFDTTENVLLEQNGVIVILLEELKRITR